jgi:hypothetical protein
MLLLMVFKSLEKFVSYTFYKGLGHILLKQKYGDIFCKSEFNTC